MNSRIVKVLIVCAVSVAALVVKLMQADPGKGTTLGAGLGMVAGILMLVLFFETERLKRYPQEYRKEMYWNLAVLAFVGTMFLIRYML